MTPAETSPRSTATSRFLANILKIQAGEERLIGVLMLLYFITSLGFVFVQSMAFGIFLAEYHVEGLPYSYIAIAIIASLVALIYIRLGGRVSFSTLLTINLLFLGVGSLLIWLGLNSPFFHLVSFILPLWFQIVVNLGNLLVWSMAGRLFDFRQAKRLFPLLGAGNWLANIIGGLFITPLVKSIGAIHLLVFAALSFGGALLVLRYISRAYLQAPAGVTVARQPARPTKSPPSFFKDRYVLLIFLYTVLWWVAFFFVDNIFYNRAFVQYPDADQLTAFIGRLLSIIGIVALISSTVITSRVIARFGMRVGLIAMPLAVTLTLGVLALSGSLGISLFYIFILSTLAKLINVSFGFSMSQSANALVYQSLPDTIRGRVQATAEGIVQPVAVGLAGISLLILTSALKFGYIGLSYFFVGLGLAWLAGIFLLSGNYLNALTQVILKRRLGDSTVAVTDPASLTILKNRLHDPHPGVAIYALNQLEALEPQLVPDNLPNLLQHPAPEVRREALMRIENQRLLPLANQVQQCLALETDPEVKEFALRALGAITHEPAQLVEALHATDNHSLRGALIGLLKNGNEPLAEHKMNDLLASTCSTDRNLALEVLGEVKRSEWFPQLISACDSPDTTRSAGLALASIGPQVLPEIEPAFCDPAAPRLRLLTLSRSLGRIGGAHAQDILLSRLAEPDGEARSQIFYALSQSGYREPETFLIQNSIHAEVERAAWLSAAQADLGSTPAAGLLIAALQQLSTDVRDRILMLLSLKFRGDSIRHVREALRAGSPAQVSYALEILDVQLPAEWKKMVMPIMENLSPLERSRRLSAQFPQSREQPVERLQEILKDEWLPHWVRACALYTSRSLSLPIPKGDEAMLSTVEKVLILKTVSMFSQTPDNVLSEVADLLDEVDVSENETIFHKGDTGDSLYIILDGKVRVHDGDRLLDDLGERDIFGEMALLDPEPRLASVTAVEATHLFRLDQAPFYELMSERPEVARGIIRVLTARLRDRVRDNAQLTQRIAELESRRPA